MQNPCHLRCFQWRVQLGTLSVRPEEWPSQLSAQRSQYDQWVREYPYVQEVEVEEEQEERPELAVGKDLDPLTAMWMEDHQQTSRLQQLDLKYRKEKAMRKRGMAGGERTFEEETLTQHEERTMFLQIIDKDLNRLPDPDELHGTNVCTAYRKEILRQVLYIFACRHSPDPGYQQGMHEIASYFLYALELDGCGAPIAAASADTYNLLENVLEQIQPAYDVTADPTTNKSPLEQMSLRILQVIARHDAKLYQTLMSLQVPPQLIFTKWIRLLYSREVTNVLPLWDAVFACAQSVQQVAEGLAAARLLVHRNLLLEQQQDLLQLLMNMPVEENIQPLVAVLNPLLEGRPLPLPAPAPVRPVAAAAAAATATAAAWADPLTQAFSSMTTNNTNTNSLGTPPNPLADNNRFSLTGVKDRLASKTQFIGKRLYQEWEHISNQSNSNQQQTQPPSNERNYDDPPPDPLHAMQQQRPEPSRYPVPSSPIPPPHSTPSSSFTPRQLAIQMNGSIGILQSFAVQQRDQVPEKVWEALSNLEVIRQNLVAMDNTK